MIYNYKDKNPVLISAKDANVLFPGFDFGNDTNRFFIFPQDGVVYNYTLSIFYTKDKQYAPKAGPANQLGQFIGYTQKEDDQLPTLYYTNGRLTLQHNNCRNIGWHPRKLTINKEAVSYVYGNVSDPDNYVKGGKFDMDAFNKSKTAGAADLTKSKLVELYYNNKNIIVSKHPSRSYLKPGQPGNNFVFNPNSAFLAPKEINPLPF